MQQLFFLTEGNPIFLSAAVNVSIRYDPLNSYQNLAKLKTTRTRTVCCSAHGCDGRSAVMPQIHGQRISEHQSDTRSTKRQWRDAKDACGAFLQK